MKKAEKVLIAAVDYDTQFDFYSIPAVYVKNCRKMLKCIETDFDRENDFHAAQLFRYLMLILKGLFYEKLFFSDYRLAYSSVVIDKSSRMIFMKGIDSGDVEIDEDENEDTSSGEGVFFNINIPIDVLDKNDFCIPKDYQVECVSMAAQIAKDCPTPIGDRVGLTKRLMFKYMLSKLEIIFEGSSCSDCLTIGF